MDAYTEVRIFLQRMFQNKIFKQKIILSKKSTQKLSIQLETWFWMKAYSKRFRPLTFESHAWYTSAITAVRKHTNFLVKRDVIHQNESVISCRHPQRMNEYFLFVRVRQITILLQVTWESTTKFLQSFLDHWIKQTNLPRAVSASAISFTASSFLFF